MIDILASRRYLWGAMKKRLSGAVARVSIPLLLLFGWLPGDPAALAKPPMAPAGGEGLSQTPRRVNVRPTTGSIDAAWSTAPIFWFGRATDTDNYVDVRVAYDGQAFYLWAAVVDYYLWWAEAGDADPRGYDALAIYLDTGGNGGAAPQSDDFLLVSGYRFWPTGNDVRWHRQGRGTGSGWDEGWTPALAWTDSPGCRFYNSGPNNNGDLDGGWTTVLTIPWATLGLSGPPAAGTRWGLGALLFDRDDRPPAGAIGAKTWPESFAANSPSTWGILAFAPAAPAPGTVVTQGTTPIRRGLNGTVVDAYVGGGGVCGGGRFGGGDVPHPDDNLFVQNQADIADFPCFSKSYLRFDLGAVPAGKTIISATLRIYEFGGSDPTQAYPSYIQLFSVADPWEESTLTWNNAPLAAENLSGTWVYPLTSFPGWPGVAAEWDATALVSRAHAAGEAANLVLYAADLAYHSGKYFVSSESGEWNASGRPTLTVVWGQAVPAVKIEVAPHSASVGNTLTSTIAVTGSGRALGLFNALPAPLEYAAGSASGGLTYDGGSRALRWDGTLAVGETKVFTYNLLVATASRAALLNTVVLTDAVSGPLTDTASILVNPYGVHVPLIYKNPLP